MWYIHTKRILFSDKKKKEILPFTITWMEFESIVLSEKSQIEKDTILYDFIPIYGTIKKQTPGNRDQI